MKQYTSLLACLLFSLIIQPLQAQKPPKDFVFFNDSTLISIYEVRNNEYRQFIFDEFVDDIFEFLDGSHNIPENYQVYDTSWITPKIEEYQISTNDYFVSPSYDNYPVVCITKEAMEAYCEWKTDFYNNDPKRKYTKVRFRLPSEQEWMTVAAAKPGLSLPWVERVPYRIGKKNEIVPLANLKAYDITDGSYNHTYDNSFFPARTGFYPPNDLGVYEIIGNVAEMTDSGVIKGGSWDNTTEESKIHKEQTYKLPHPCVGFRVVMEIVSE